jgi:hypothetical protein
MGTVESIYRTAAFFISSAACIACILSIISINKSGAKSIEYESYDVIRRLKACAVLAAFYAISVFLWISKSRGDAMLFEEKLWATFGISLWSGAIFFAVHAAFHSIKKVPPDDREDEDEGSATKTAKKILLKDSMLKYVLIFIGGSVIWISLIIMSLSGKEKEIKQLSDELQKLNIKGAISTNQ